MVQVGKDSGWGGGGGDCSVSSTGLKGLRLRVDAIAGRAVVWRGRDVSSRQGGLLKYLHHCHLPKGEVENVRSIRSKSKVQLCKSVNYRFG